MLFGKEYDFSLIRTSSKEALLRTALSASGNDIKKATEIVEYFTKQLPSMPEVDPVAPSTFEQMRDTALGLINWGKENQDQIMSVISFARQFIGKGTPTPTPPTDVTFDPV